jgi:hypothetical protein
MQETITKLKMLWSEVAHCWNYEVHVSDLFQIFN